MKQTHPVTLRALEQRYDRWLRKHERSRLGLTRHNSRWQENQGYYYIVNSNNTITNSGIDVAWLEDLTREAKVLMPFEKLVIPQ